MKLNTQTLFITPEGENIQRIDDFLYNPIGDVVIIGDHVWNITDTIDEFEDGNWLVRKITVELV